MVSPAALAWLHVAVCALLIGVAGTFLSRDADVTAAKTGRLNASFVNHHSGQP